MKYTWGFDIGTGVSALHYGFEAFVYDSTSYLAKVLPKSFDGVVMRCDLSGRLYQPNETGFSVDNGDGALSESDFEGRRCCVSLLGDGVLIRQWTFIIQTACEAYGEIRCDCIDPVARYLDGDFPNTPSLAANFPSGEIHEEKDVRVPITLGTAFIPVAPFLSGGSRYYCLGKTGYTYTINKVRTPRSWDVNQEWDNSYTYTQSDKTGEQINVRAAQLIIADSDGDGSPDANGVWPKSGKILPALIEYSGPYSSTTGPGSWISTILQLFGIDAAYLDTSSFTGVDTSLSGVTWGGGFWKAENRETLLASLLSNCDCFLSCETDVTLNLFSKTAVETLATVKKMTFAPGRTEKSASDGVTVRFAWSGEPGDDLSGEAVVGLYGAQASVDNPSADVFEYRFGTDNSDAQAFGILNAQKTYDQKYRVTFDHKIGELATKSTLVPGQVLTVYYQTAAGLKVYGDSKDVVVSEMHFQRDGTVAFSGTVYNHLEEYADLAPAAVTADTSLNNDFEFLSLTKLVQVSGINIFHYAAGASTPAPTSVTLTATLFGGLTDYLWQYWTGSAWSDLSGTNDESTYTLAHDNAAWGSAVSLRVRCLSGDYYGEITVTKVTDGSDGADGSSGPGIVYRGAFDAGETYYNDPIRQDVVIYSGTPYKFTKSGATIADGGYSGAWNASYWTQYGTYFDMVATDLALAQDVVISHMLTFTGDPSYIKVTGTDGLVIDIGGDSTAMKLTSGSGIQFNAASGSPSFLQFSTGTYNINIGAAYGTENLVFWCSTANEGKLGFGYNPRGASPGIRRLQGIYNYAYRRIDLDQDGGGYGDSLIKLSDGTITLTTSNDFSVTVGDNFTISVTDYVTISADNIDLDSSGNLSSIASIVCSGGIQCGSITTIASTPNIGSTSYPFNILYLKGRLRIYSGSDYRDLLSTATTTGGPSGDGGYWTVSINGTTRYLKLYSSPT